MIGTAKLLINAGKVPNLLGKIKSNNDHNSFKWFCIGEPDIMILWLDFNCFAAIVIYKYFELYKYIHINTSDIFLYYKKA